MVCYTNHALDQFLENCIEQCGLTDGVVRVGGQSKSENLEDFKLKNIKRERKWSSRNRRELNRIHRRVNKKRRNLNFEKRRIICINELISCLKNGHGLLHFKHLEKFIDKNCLAYFRSGNKGPDYSLLEWLGFFDDELELLRLMEDIQYDDGQEDAFGISDLFSMMSLDPEVQKLNLLNENGKILLKFF